MKKILIAMLIFLTFISCAKQQDTSEKMEIGELISIRNAYEKEYDLISMEIEGEKVLRQVEMILDGEIKTQIDVDKITRQQILKDSIEILNVMINNYKF